jgi:hypothetical protein
MRRSELHHLGGDLLGPVRNYRIQTKAQRPLWRLCGDSFSRFRTSQLPVPVSGAQRLPRKQERRAPQAGLDFVFRRGALMI